MDHSLKHIVLTGHEDGKVLIWGLDAFIDILFDYQVEITCMSKCYDGYAIATKLGNIFIWDVNLTTEMRDIDFNNMPFQVLSNNITSMDYNQ